MPGMGVGETSASKELVLEIGIGGYRKNILCSIYLSVSCNIKNESVAGNYNDFVVGNSKRTGPI